MTVHADYAHPEHVSPPGFRARRGLNWGAIGMLYASFYLCRYNFSFANKAISDEFGYSKGQMGWIITVTLFLYACGQIINGLLTDKIGGKRAMLAGAAGTVLLNIAFGAASYAGMFGLFLAIRGLDGYMQSFGAPGMIKINAAWFHRKERGRFAGVFGFMINLGRFGINWLAPAIVGGVVIAGLIAVPPQHWRWLFWIPSVVCAGVAVMMALIVRETPEQAGFYRPDPDEPMDAPPPPLHPTAAIVTSEGSIMAETIARPERPDYAGIDRDPSLRHVVRKIATNPAVWICALAYACTGAVRQGIDQWFPRYMMEVFHTDMKSAEFQILAWSIPIVATLGSLMSGYISDIFFEGRRAPVAAALYLIETIIILIAAQFHSVNAVIVSFVLIAFTANSTHSIIGTAAAMDIGGRKMSGFASGCIDSFQYFGGMLAGWGLGSLIEKNWDYYFYFFVPFGLAGAALMFFARHRIAPKGERVTDEGKVVPADTAPQ